MDKYLFGTQYYRSPTPLENEWEYDLNNMTEYYLDTIQIRINWRNNERKENCYDFSDVDKLLLLAHKYHKKVIIKFLLECAPQYIFDKYEGTRIGPRGEKLRGGYHGAFYGGWQPCFSSKKIQSRAIKFVKTVVSRCKDNQDIILYNAWNEIRNRPIEDCFCSHCKKEFQLYLSNKFHTIEKLNEFYGASEENFDTIDLPSTPHGVWDIYEFKKWRGEVVNHQKVKMVYDAIRSIDKTTPIMCHVGYSASFQSNINDVVNDFYVKNAVDFLGTSIPFEQHMDTFNHRMDLQLINDFMYCVDKNYVVHELYPSLGRFLLYDNPFEFEYKMLKILSRGSKGIFFWQYRSERVGHEMDCSGIMHMNGEPREITKKVKDVGAFVKSHGDLLLKLSPKQPEIGILFDFDSMLLSEIEDNFGVDYEFSLWNPIYYYIKAHQGLYRLANSLNYKAGYISTSDMSNLDKYKAIFVPYLNMLTKEISSKLENYVFHGGRLIIEDGFGLRDINTWINPYRLSTNLMQAQMIYRMRERGTVRFDQQEALFGPYNSVYEIKDSEVLGTFANGKPAIQKISVGKGESILLGFSLGESSYETQNAVSQVLFKKLISGLNINKETYSNVEKGIEASVLENENKQLLFIFNTSKEDYHLSIEKNYTQVYGDIKKEGDNIYLPKESFAIFSKD